MSRNLKIIIIMSAAILLMAAALIALSCDSCGEEEPAAPSASDTVTDTADFHSELSGVHLHENLEGTLLVNKDELISVRLISDKGDYLIRRGDDGVLNIDALSGLLQESDFMEDVWYNSLAFGYSYELHSEQPLNLADFGLDPAALTIECEYTDGTACRLFVGNSISTSPNIYYFRMEGRDEVFINEFDISYFQGDQFWLSDDIFGDDVEDVTIGTIKLSGAAFPDGLTLEHSTAADKSCPGYGYDYVVTSPYRGLTDNYLMTLFTDELTELVADEAVCAFPTEEQLAGYGLDKPDVVITHQRNGAQKILRIARADVSTMYAKADGVECVFMLSADTFPMLAALSPEYLRAPEVHIAYFDAVHSIRIQCGDADYTFRLERTPLETDNTLFEYRAYYGDTQLVLSDYKALLEVFNRATSVSYGGKPQSDSPAMTVTVTFFDGLERSREIIEYFPAGTRRYLVSIDGSGDAVVSQMWVDAILDAAKALSNGETVTP